jgi:CubicO group peptidase (beta-lactamase class C family)
MEEIRSFVGRQLEAWEVPGCAVVAVKDGRVVLNEGFGLRDVAANLPVTTKTLFAIGSTTKAFTCAGVGAMVDDGLIEWDKPLVDYMPGFKMHDPVATERITPIDLLCHRSGLPRHDLSWIGFPERSRADLVHKLRYLPLSRDIRMEFQYCNLGFVTAGHLIEVVTGMSWEDYLATRLLKPLGMDRTNFSVGEARRSDDFSKPYERRGSPKVIEIPFRQMDAAGPAGSICSCTDDMLHWLLVHLGSGRSGGNEVISSDTIARMHHIQMAHAEDTLFAESSRFGYGLGWSIGQYRGRRIVEHGGGIDGSLTECMLIPGDDVGVVVLTNSSSGLMGRVVADRVIDELLGAEPIDWFARYKGVYDATISGEKEAKAERPRVEGAALPRPAEEYAGDYENPGYGVLSIKVEDGGLVPAFGTLDVSLTHRHFDVFDLEWRELTQDFHVFPLTFLSSPDGDVIALTVPFETALGPIQFDRLPDPRSTDPRVLQGFTGVYSMGPIDIIVGLRGERTLTISTAGSPAAELEPGRGLRFTVKEQPTVTLEFVLKPDGTVEKIVVQPMGIFTPKE